MVTVLSGEEEETIDAEEAAASTETREAVAVSEIVVMTDVVEETEKVGASELLQRAVDSILWVEVAVRSVLPVEPQPQKRDAEVVVSEETETIDAEVVVSEETEMIDVVVVETERWGKQLSSLAAFPHTTSTSGLVLAPWFLDEEKILH